MTVQYLGDFPISIYHSLRDYTSLNALAALHKLRYEKRMQIFRRSLGALGLSVMLGIFGHPRFEQVAFASGKSLYAYRDELRTELFEASKKGDLKAVSEILKNLYIGHFEKNRALLFAAETGHISVVEALLKANASPLQPREDGSTPLFMAAQNGHFEVVKLLIRKGADVNYPRHDGVTPLLIATEHQHEDIIKLLIEEEADPFKAPLHGPNCVSRAYELERNDLAQTLLEARISECPICLEALNCNNCGVYTTACGHKFHFEGCMDRVLRSSNRKCPLCNHPLPAQTGD